jgi:hypothetical protein
MESGGIKSSGTIRPQDLGSPRPSVRRVSARSETASTGDDSLKAWSRRVPETDNLVSANGRVYDRASPRGTYLDILV